MDVIRKGIDLLFSDRYCSYRNVVAVIGLLWLSWLLLKVLKAVARDICAYFLAPWGISRTNLKKYGKWAVVTGASEGIGRGYALELARQGLDVVIMSRSEEKLQKVSDEIKEKYGCDVRIIPVDFSNGMEIYPRIAEELQDLDVGILINNVGLGYEYPDLIHDYPAEKFHKMIELNCQSMVQMVKVMLPKLLEKKKGLIVNISSSSSGMMPPMLTVYAATKSFVDSFSGGLCKEYASDGITVQCVGPFFVATSMSGIRRTSFMVPDGVKFARAALATIGIKNFTHGCFSHAIQGYVFYAIPSCIRDYFIWKTLKAARARALKKKAKAK